MSSRSATDIDTYPPTTTPSIPKKQQKQQPVAAMAVDPPPQHESTGYPKEFASFVNGRTKRKLGNAFGLVNFGVNHTTLAPGASSAVPHYHATQDEFVYILRGTVVLRLGGEERFVMQAGDCMGFPKATGVAHCLVNESHDEPVEYLEVGDRSPNEVCEYPGYDLRYTSDQGFLHKDGMPYNTD